MKLEPYERVCRKPWSAAFVLLAALFLSLSGAAQESARLERATELLSANRVAEARAELEALLAADPGNRLAAAYLAAAELQAGAVEQAIARTRRLLETEPENTDLQALLGKAYAAAGEWQAAEKQWRVVLERRPNSEEAHIQLATALLQLSRFDQGLAEVTRALEINPRRSDGRALRGNLLAALGRFDEAARDWNEALAVDMNNPAALAGLAVYLRNREPEFALEYARRAVELSNWEALGPIRILALVYWSRGDTTRAREVIEKALRKFPDSVMLQAGLREMQQAARAAPPGVAPRAVPPPAAPPPAAPPPAVPPPAAPPPAVPPPVVAQSGLPLSAIRTPALAAFLRGPQFVDRGLPVSQAAGHPAPAAAASPPSPGNSLGDVARYYRKKKQAQPPPRP